MGKETYNYVKIFFLLIYLKRLHILALLYCHLLKSLICVLFLLLNVTMSKGDFTDLKY